MSMDTPTGAGNSSGTPITATLGISIEPLDTVLAQISTLPSSMAGSSTTSNSNALVPLSAAGSVSPDSVVVVAQKVMTHLYNHVTSFATAVLPPGSTVLVPTGGPGSAASVLSGGMGSADSSFLPVKAFNDWYQNVIRKTKSDPMFMSRE